MVWLIQFYRDVALAMPGHETLMLADGTFQVPGSPSIHLVEPVEGHCTPGVVDGLAIDLGQAEKVIGAGV
jgi:hypothetical protein